MKKIKYFLFSLICMFCCGIVFAKNEISVEKMIPIYDENSGVIVTEDNGVHSVIFNDKDQSVKYNIVLKNNTNDDISLQDIILPKSPEAFLVYELTGVGDDAVLKANSTKDVVLSLKTIKTEGWGRNFTLDLTNKIEVLETVSNPNTAVNEVIVVLVFAFIATSISIVLVRNKKISKYIVFVAMLGSIVTIADAKKTIIFPIKLNVNFESQNIMIKSGTTEEICFDVDDCFDEYTPVSFWEYNYAIKDIYIENKLSDVQDYTYKFDVSEKQDGKVMAYLVDKAEEICYDLDYEETSCYDLYLQADGIIYPNNDASYYFAMMNSLDSINNIVGLDTSNVTNMSYMFYDAGAESTKFTLDVSNFETSEVTNMSHMFEGTGFTNADFTLDVSKFNTSKVTDMSYMFYSTGCNSTKLTLDVSNFDTSNVTNMSHMFENLGVYDSDFTLDISNFNTSNVTNMSWMFRNLGISNPNFTLDVSNFDTSKVTDMSFMFYGTGYESNKFDTSITIRNSGTNLYDFIFSDVAIQPGSKITVNYTSETSDIVDEMIATKSDESNVVKGVQVD